MKKITFENNYRLIETDFNSLPIWVLTNFNLMSLHNDIVYLVQVKVNKDLWCTKKVILRNKYSFGINYILNGGKHEKDTNFLNRARKDFYRFIRKNTHGYL